MRMDDSATVDDMLDDTMYKGKTTKDKKTMTMSDVADDLMEDFADEIADSKKYMRMAHVAESAKAYRDSHYLTEMAKDEYTHATYIRSFLKDHGIEIPEDQDEKYIDLREDMSKFF